MDTPMDPAATSTEARATAPTWTGDDFNALSPGRLYAIMKLRQDVFIVEQDCIYPDLDDLDPSSVHLCAWQGDTLLAYARCLPPGLDYTESAIGRIVVAPAARGLKLGRELVLRAIELNLQRWPGAGIKIGAQAHLEAFYQDLGFDTVSDVYDEDGIPHIKMLLRQA